MSDRQDTTTPCWIGAPIPENWTPAVAYPPIVLRRSLTLEQLGEAALEITALGLYEASINGSRVGDHHLAPEWTNYHKRVQYQCYDVAPLLRAGENTIEVTLADGWYSGRIGLSYELKAPRNRGIYGPRPRLWARILVDGEVMLASDGNWEYAEDGPLRSACLLDGEVRDFRKSPSDFRPVAVDRSIRVRLSPQSNEPIRITEELAPKQIVQRDPQTYIVDFGQNIAGWIRARFRGPESTDVRIRHGEMLDREGNLYRDNLRINGTPGAGAQQEDHAILSGASGGDLFEPRFTYHGFRYVEVSGLPEAPDQDELRACVVHSDCRPLLRFSCSNSMLNRLMTAVDWTLRDNLHSIPTDCPQRDERLGWAGDAQVVAQTACYLRDMRGLFAKYVRDLVEGQTEDGRVPDFAPHPYEPERHFSGNAGWADAIIVIPYRVWQTYGDLSIADEHFDAMYRWIDAVHRANPSGVFAKLFPSPLAYSDWLNADTFALERFPKGRAATAIELFGTAMYARSIGMLERMAQATGRDRVASELGALHAKVVQAFRDAFVLPDGRITGETQASYAFALAYDLLPAEHRPAAFAQLLRGIEEFDGHLSTGFLGTIEVLKLLSEYGENDLAYRIVTNESFPSWGYMLANGATTIWERWDGYVPDRVPDVFQDAGMNSFNHYSIGSVGEWIVRTVGGLRLDESEPSQAGFRHFVIRPQPGPGVTWSKLAYESPFGPVAVEWSLEKGTFAISATVPPGSSARLVLPGGSEHRLAPGNHYFTD